MTCQIHVKVRGLKKDNISTAVIELYAADNGG